MRFLKLIPWEWDNRHVSMILWPVVWAESELGHTSGSWNIMDPWHINIWLAEGGSWLKQRVWSNCCVLSTPLHWALVSLSQLSVGQWKGQVWTNQRQCSLVTTIVISHTGCLNMVSSKDTVHCAYLLQQDTGHPAGAMPSNSVQLPGES